MFRRRLRLFQERYKL